MENLNGEITNEFNIGDLIYIWTIASGKPILKLMSVLAIRLHDNNIEYKLIDTANECDEYNILEKNTFSSIDDAVQVFNESQDDIHMIHLKREINND